MNLWESQTRWWHSFKTWDKWKNISQWRWNIPWDAQEVWYPHDFPSKHPLQGIAPLGLFTPTIPSLSYHLAARTQLFESPCLLLESPIFSWQLHPFFGQKHNLNPIWCLCKYESKVNHKSLDWFLPLNLGGSCQFSLIFPQTTNQWINQVSSKSHSIPSSFIKKSHYIPLNPNRMVFVDRWIPIQSHEIPIVDD